MSRVTLRRATPADVTWLDLWDHDPGVIACSIAPNLRAVDIWIGAAADRGHGHGREMLRLALERCFADPRVTGIVIDPLASNERAHVFYRRLGFKPIGRRTFGADDCLVHELTRDEWQRRRRG